MGRTTNGKTQLRWLARAALVLAGACGDDGATPERDAGRGEVTARAPDDDAAPGAAPDDDASADAGSAGGSALLDEDRIEHTALTFCTFSFECSPEMSGTYLESAEACLEIVEAFVRDGAALDGAACGHAQLDSYECYASAGCEEQLTACEQEAERESAACPLSLGEL